MTRMLVVLALLGFAALPAAQVLDSPVRFAVIGDNGTGDRPQFDVGRQMVRYREDFPFDFVLMLGDNTYGRASARELSNVFERPYKPLLDAGVRFFASLGNHDDPNNRTYPHFHMAGERYYTYAERHVRFFVLDTNVLDTRQLEWFDNALRTSVEPWKVVYFHHAIYSNGARHGSNVELRVKLEPVMIRHGVNVVFSGHDHLYERLKPQKGIAYFVAGASGKLRKGVRRSEQSAFAYDQDQSFMLVEIARDEMRFRAISRTGTVVDSGAIPRQPST